MDIKQFIDQLDYPAFNALYQAVTSRKAEEQWKSHPLPALNEPEKVLIKGDQLVAAIKLYRTRIQELTGFTPGLRETKDLCVVYRDDSVAYQTAQAVREALRQSTPLYKKEKED